MKKLKIMTIVGTRPEIIRLSRVISRLDDYTDHVLVHTGQNYDYELNEIFFGDLRLRKPKHFLKAAGKTASETIGQTIMRIEPLLLRERPDGILILGDTNSCLAAIPAKRLKIPIFHMEAGNRCFDQRVPEEINRKIVDHISDINLPYSSIAREYLIREGIAPDRIIKTGSPMYEVLSYYADGIESSDILERLRLEPFEFIVVSFHREENVDNNPNFASFITVLKELSRVYRRKIIVSTHPRTRKRLVRDRIKVGKSILFCQPFGFRDYVKLEKNAYAVLSDSGTITEESSILNFPALNIRQAHERPEGMEEAAVMMTGLNVNRILQAMKVIEAQPRGQQRLLRVVSDYSVPNVSEKVVRIIMSYIDYVNRTVWEK